MPKEEAGDAALSYQEELRRKMFTCVDRFL